MRVAAREGLSFAAALLLGLALNSGKGSAAECGDVYDGAKVGPPPEWSFWADGSACFVRWVPDDDSHEERLLERCQNTPGARFVHFERRKTNGHSICIFKVLDSEPGELLVQQSEPLPLEGKADLQGEPASQPAPAADPEIVLENLEALVRGRNEDCLGKERAQDPFGAGACWKAAAQEVTKFTDANPLPRKDLERKLGELRETWLARAAQLEGTAAQSKEQAILIQPSSIGAETNSEEDEPDTSRNEDGSEDTETAVDQPAEEAAPESGGSTSHDGPDPERLSATMSCSSTTLGNYEDCVSSAKPSSDNKYAFALKSQCRQGSIAAIRTTDAQGRCVRRVITLLPNGDGGIVESHGEPSVIDAIEYGRDRYECYERRHDNISCNGQIDYSAQQSAKTTDEKKEVTTTPQPRKKVAKKRTKKSKKARRKTPRKTQAVAKAPDPPKKKSKREDESQVIRNYTQKPEPRERVKKAKVAQVQSKSRATGPEKPSVGCLLFSKLC
jgi:hypothetical protein